jgi:xanthine dehydrogenase accessory factor
MKPEQNAVRLDPSPEMLAQRLNVVETSCVVATVVSAAGSTYRKPGARMLIEADGRITGLLSGGCFEQDLREHATRILANGVARMVTYDMRGENDLIFGIGAGCEGSMGILLEPAPYGSPVARAIVKACELARQGEAVALATLHEGPAELLGTHLWHPGGESSLGEKIAYECAQAIESAQSRAFSGAQPSGMVSAWIQPLLPLPAVLICGAGPDAQPLAAALQALHFPVTVTDHRAAYADIGNFPGAEVVLGAAAGLAERLDLTRFFAAVVMSHHLASDAAYLTALAATDIAYLGVLGPRMRRERLLTTMGSAALGMQGRLRGPIGLDIGAATPEGIALAIAAEIYATAAGRGGAPFKREKN